MDEEILIEKLKAGDGTSFNVIVERWQAMVYNTALSILQNVEDAEDITQETFVKVYQSISTFKGESKFSTWLYRITVTKSLDHIRKRKRKKSISIIKNIFGVTEEIEEKAIDFQHPGVMFDKKEDAAILFRAMNQLSDNQRTVFVLCKIEGLSYQEISEIMDTSISAVESLMHRAKVNLKEILQNRFEKLK